MVRFKSRVLRYSWDLELLGRQNVLDRKCEVFVGLHRERLGYGLLLCVFFTLVTK